MEAENTVLRNFEQPPPSCPMVMRSCCLTYFCYLSDGLILSSSIGREGASPAKRPWFKSLPSHSCCKQRRERPLPTGRFRTIGQARRRTSSSPRKDPLREDSKRRPSAGTLASGPDGDDLSRREPDHRRRLALDAACRRLRPRSLAHRLILAWG